MGEDVVGPCLQGVSSWRGDRFALAGVEGDLSVEQPLDAEEVVDAAEGAVEIGVLGAAGEAAAVVDGSLHDRESGGAELGGEEAVHAVEGDEVIDGLAAEGLEGAAGVAEAVLDEAAADPIGDLGGPAAGGGVACAWAR